VPQRLLISARPWGATFARLILEFLCSSLTLQWPREAKPSLDAGKGPAKVRMNFRVFLETSPNLTGA